MTNAAMLATTLKNNTRKTRHIWMQHGFQEKSLSWPWHISQIQLSRNVEHPDKLKLTRDTTIDPPTDVLWYGTNQIKGVWRFSYSNYKFKLLDIHNADLKVLLPIAAHVFFLGLYSFAILGVLQPGILPAIISIGHGKQFYHYESILKCKNTIPAVGPLTAIFWDKSYTWKFRSHSMVAGTGNPGYFQHLS